MNTVADRKKQREEYLKKKAKAYSIGLAAMLICLLLFGIGMPRLCKFMGESVAKQTLSESTERLTWMIWGLLCFLPFTGVMILGKQAKRAKALPHIPPITVETLPAEEVLVRGTEPPSATRDTLLRPAINAAQTPAEQLLRATNGVGSEPS